MTAIGIFGGTFDPIHIGHLAIAEEARVELGLEGVLFVPAAQQPLKYWGHAASAAHRLEMARLACATNPAFVVSPIEAERVGPSYTVDTLELLRSQGYSDLVFMLGADALVDVPKWHRAADLPKLATIAAIGRPGVNVDFGSLLQSIPELTDRVRLIEGPRLEISSSEVRQRLAQGRSVRYLVPDAVIEYMQRHNLYRNKDIGKWRMANNYREQPTAECPK